MNKLLTISCLYLSLDIQCITLIISYINVFIYFRMIASLARIGNSTTALHRYFNCWTAAITKKHRAIYEHTYPTTLVLSDGSSIEIEYHEPRKIIVLPLNMSDLTEEEQKKRLEMRKPKTKVVITEDIEDSFDENRYLNFKK